MTLAEMIDLLNSDLENEYKHFRFYLHSSIMVTGMQRFFLVPWLIKQADEEKGHVIEFANKIRALGGIPTAESRQFPKNISEPYEIINYALQMEKEVVANYHVRHAQAVELSEKTGKHYDLVVLLEDQIEHSQQDIDELKMVLNQLGG
jgi:bacterioferritin (cytochrome b1)